MVIEYSELVEAMTTPSPALSEKIRLAYGYSGLGILAVRGIPDLASLRSTLLPLANRYANLPDSVKNETTRPHAYFQVGWSHGNEKLQGDAPDWGKGSYYANPLVDAPSDDPELVKRFPSFLEPNVWPDEGMPELEKAFKGCGKKVVEVGRLVARLCDDFVSTQVEGYEGRMEQVLTESKIAKGRLLHYYPKEEVERMSGGGSAAASGAAEADEDTDWSSWCGWHNDHGSLTGLVPATYTNATGHVVPSPDPMAGLYVRARDGRLVKVEFPEEEGCLAFQIGETAQVHTGGCLQATPHAVRGSKFPGYSRQTFAVFMEPEHDGPMPLPPGRTVADVQSGEAVKFLPKGCRTLGSRWKEGMDFGQFSEATFASFY